MKSREEHIEFHRNYCVHYDPQGVGCKAGRDRETVQCVPTPTGRGDQMLKWGPCIGGHHLADPLQACPSWERHSQESGEQYADDIAACMDRMAIAGPVISAWRAKPPLGKSEVITCPVCAGKLHLSQAACNGHVRARCETERCIRFIE